MAINYKYNEKILKSKMAGVPSGTETVSFQTKKKYSDIKQKLRNSILYVFEFVKLTSACNFTY